MSEIGPMQHERRVADLRNAVLDDCEGVRTHTHTMMWQICEHLGAKMDRVCRLPFPFTFGQTESLVIEKCFVDKFNI